MRGLRMVAVGLLLTGAVACTHDDPEASPTSTTASGATPRPAQPEGALYTGVGVTDRSDGREAVLCGPYSLLMTGEPCGGGMTLPLVGAKAKGLDGRQIRVTGYYDGKALRVTAVRHV